MSYSFRVEADEAGQPHLKNFTGTFPGPLSVSGHEDAHSASVGVTRLDEQNDAIIQASAYKVTKNPPPHVTVPAAAVEQGANSAGAG